MWFGCTIELWIVGGSKRAIDGKLMQIKQAVCNVPLLVFHIWITVTTTTTSTQYGWVDTTIGEEAAIAQCIGEWLDMGEWAASNTNFLKATGVILKHTSMGDNHFWSVKNRSNNGFMFSLFVPTPVLICALFLTLLHQAIEHRQA